MRVRRLALAGLALAGLIALALGIQSAAEYHPKYLEPIEPIEAGQPSKPSSPTPPTDETLKAWGAEGLGSVDVICPGFSADCLETLDEIAQENRAYFERAGGGRFRYIPALNERGDHMDALAAIAKRALG